MASSPTINKFKFLLLKAMIGRITGTILEICSNTVLTDVNGVGYEVFCSRACIEKLLIGERHSIVIYTDVKEESISLFGFEDKQEKQVFLLLLKVKGVGARSASQIISRANKLDLLRTIGSNDVAKLQAVKGIGKKLAERIVVELRDQVSEFVIEQANIGRGEGEIGEPYNDAISALQALGFSRRDAESAVMKAKAGGVPKGAGGTVDSGRVVKEALRFV